MLINARHADELRVAIIEDGVLEAYEVEAAESGMRRGNIYRGVVAKVESSLNAAFIDYGAERHGFLPGDDIVPEAYHRKVDDSAKHPPIASVLQKGQPILVQVTKEAVGQKGAALTTSLSIAGRYMVLTPFDDTRGVSRKVEDEKARKKLRKQLSSFSMPDGCGVIARTNALDQLKTSLSRDLNALLRLWRRLESEAGKGKGPRLLYSDQDLVLQALRDFLDTSIEEVYVDDDTVFRKAEDYMRAFMPRAKTELIRYEERIPLFARFHLDEQIARIYDRTVQLPSGGSIVIDGTEALTAIDVNSGKTRGGTSHEDTVARTNVEAAAEVARQLRMRDIGGLVVVDFIDMRQRRNHRKVEKALRDAMKVDRARTSIGRISENGLLEINRQRVKQALELRTHRDCPTCNGSGTIASPEFVALGLLRRIEARAAAGDLKAVRVALHPELADGFQNHRRQELAELEREFDIQIEVVAATHLHRSDEVVEWKRRQLGKHDPEIAPRPAKAALTASDVMSEEDAEPSPSKKRRRPPNREEREKAAEGAKGAAEDTGEDTGERRPRRRRRGGRRRKKSNGDAATVAERAAAGSAGPQEQPPPAAADSPPQPSSDGHEAGPPAKKRPRRRRRGKGRRGDAQPPSEQPIDPGQRTEVRWPPEPPVFTRPNRPPAVGWHTLFDGEDDRAEARPTDSRDSKPRQEAAEDSKPRQEAAEGAGGEASRGGRPREPESRSAEPAGRAASSAQKPAAEKSEAEGTTGAPAADRAASAEPAPEAESSPRPRRRPARSRKTGAGAGEETAEAGAPRTGVANAGAPKEGAPKAGGSRTAEAETGEPEKSKPASRAGASRRSSTKKGTSRTGASKAASAKPEGPEGQGPASGEAQAAAPSPKKEKLSSEAAAESGGKVSKRAAPKARQPEEKRSPSESPPPDPQLTSRPKGWPPLPGTQGG